MRTTAQLGALIFGIVFLLMGILGLFVPNGMGMDADMETTGRVLGLFPVNLLHNIVHLAFGAWGIAASRSHPASRSFGRAGAIVYALLVVLAFLDPTMFGLAPIGGNDIWLHAILALGLAYIGFAGGDTRTADTRPTDARPADTRTIDPRPVDPRPVDPPPVDTRPVDTRPVDPRPVAPRPIDPPTGGTRPTDPPTGGTRPGGTD